MAKDKRKKHHRLIADYVDDEFEQSEDEFAEFQEWKRQKQLMEQQGGQLYDNPIPQDMPDEEEPPAEPLRQRRARNPKEYEAFRRERNRRRKAARHPDKKRKGHTPERKKKKERHPFRLLFRLLLFVLLLYLAWNLVSMIGVGTGKSVRNYLLIGQDRREGEDTQRSDSMILVTVNKKKKTITLTSFMRDMYVDIPGHDKNRLNAAYEYGGMELLDQTLENAFDIKIDGNAEVDFDQFITAMSAVGTLDIELKDYEAEYLNVNSSYGGVENYAWSLTPGMNSLTPEQALAYSRIRYVGNSDWERTQRQRTVITTAFQKLKHEGPFAMMRVASKVMPNLTTDMNPGEMTALAATVGIGGYEIGETYRVPFDGLYSDVTLDSGAMVLAPDLDANKAKLHEVLYGGEADE